MCEEQMKKRQKLFYADILIEIASIASRLIYVLSFRYVIRHVNLQENPTMRKYQTAGLPIIVPLPIIAATTLLVVNKCSSQYFHIFSHLLTFIYSD